LKKNPAFGVGGEGKQVEPPSQEYLYRLTSIYTVKKMWKDPVKRVLPDGEIFAEVETDYNRRGTWLPLRDYAEGALKNDRWFTWWTNLALRPEDLLRGAHQIGLPSTWVAEEALLLRCPTTFFSREYLLHVPTVLDAFESEVFHPTESSKNPMCGHTICLNQTSPLALADEVNEYVAEPVDVEYIEFIPVLVTSAMREQPHVVRLNSDLRRLLEDYYRTLLSTGDVGLDSTVTD
jgi:hypothetical protein